MKYDWMWSPRSLIGKVVIFNKAWIWWCVIVHYASSCSSTHVWWTNFQFFSLLYAWKRIFNVSIIHGLSYWQRYVSIQSIVSNNCLKAWIIDIVIALGLTKSTSYELEHLGERRIIYLCKFLIVLYWYSL